MKHVPKIITAVVGLALVGAAVYLIAIERDEQVPWILGVGLSILGAVGTLAGARLGEPRSSADEMLDRRRKRRDEMRPPPGPGAAAVLLLAVASASPSLAACGPSALGTHARAATVTAGVMAGAGSAVDDARAAALARIETETRGQPADDRIAALDEERARWAPVGSALDTGRSALITWVQSVELARVADADEDMLRPLGQLAARVVLLYEEVAALSRGLGLDLPSLPSLVTSLAAGLGGGR